MNTVILAGNIGKDAETRPAGQKIVTSFSLAVQDGKDQTLWFNVEQWDSKITQYLKKGTKVIVEGRLKLEDYEKDGIKRTAIKIVANKIHLFGAKQEATASPATVTTEEEASELPF